MATQYKIEAAVEPGDWKPIASSNDRLPYAQDASVAAVNFDGLPDEVAAQGMQLFAELTAANPKP